MKLKSNYPTINPKECIKFNNLGQEGISLVFAQRLSAFAKDKNKALYITSGYRDVALQQRLYEENCRQYPPNGNGYVAKAGSSFHNGRVAIDLDDRAFWKGYMEQGDMKKTVKQQELYKYGLCLPLNYVDSSRVYEWWHIQPIETLGYEGVRTKFLDIDDKIYNVNGEGNFVEQWKLDVLKELKDADLVKDYEYWITKLDDKAPVWLVMTLMNNLNKKLKG
jgi:hypothetical protein